MYVATPQESKFTEEEISTLGRFGRAIGNAGIQVILTERALDSLEYSKAAVTILLRAVNDIRGRAPSRMYEAGVSLEYVVDLARATRAFPDDFLPSEELVRKCLSEFWDLNR